MICQKDDLNCLGWIVQIHVAMRMRVLVGSNRSGKKCHTPDTLTSFRRHVGQRPGVRVEGRSHEFDTDDAITELRYLTHGYLDGLHGLKRGNIEFAAHKGTPYRIGNLGVKNFARQEARDFEAGKIRFVLHAVRPAA